MLLDVFRGYRKATPSCNGLTTLEAELPGLLACSCNPATLEAEFRNGVGSIPVVGNSTSIAGLMV